MPKDIDVPVTATYRGSELVVTFTGRPVKTDYGVPHSPTIIEIEDPEITSIEILGLGVSSADLPDALMLEIMRLSDEVEWEF